MSLVVRILCPSRCLEQTNQIELNKKTGNFYLCINFESISTWRTNCLLSIHTLDVIYFRFVSYRDDNNCLCATSNMFVYKLCVLNVDDFSMIKKNRISFFFTCHSFDSWSIVCVRICVCVCVCE